MTTPRKRAHRGEIPGTVQTVQDAVYETIHNTRGAEPKALAELMGLRHRDILEIADPFRQRRLRAEEIPALIHATRAAGGEANTLVLDLLERKVGRVAIALPAIQPDRADDLKHAMRSLKEYGEQAATFVEVLEDQQVSAQECAGYTREAYEAITAILQQVAYMEAKYAERAAAGEQPPAALRSVAR